MIFILQDESKIPPAWLAKVADLKNQLEALPDAAARRAFIDRHSSVWGEIKNQLLEMSGLKCWYSEAPDAVSDWHVDHFRPKKRALDEDKNRARGLPLASLRLEELPDSRQLSQFTSPGRRGRYAGKVGLLSACQMAACGRIGISVTVSGEICLPPRPDEP